MYFNKSNFVFLIAFIITKLLNLIKSGHIYSLDCEFKYHNAKWV